MTSIRPPSIRPSLHRRYDFDRSDRDWDGVRFVARLIAVAGLLSILAGAWGCGASALQQHATAAKVTRSALDVSAAGIEAACEPDEVRQRADAQERARACVRAFEAHDSARAAWTTYVAALVLAADEDDVDLFALIPIARQLAALYREVAEAVASFGGSIPALPGLLEAL